MSAITGIYHLNEEPLNLEHGRYLMEALQKYPADDIQTWHDDHLFLGCHAQWITPESVGEQLPYYDSVRRLAITVDAIIDNRAELFDLLKVEHGQRAGMSDSQLILLAYCSWGEDTPKYIVGDFAFMIWDERKRLLFGARDFSGSRTLYYCRNNQRFAFCTAIKPLLSLPYMKKELNLQWLAEFLAIHEMFDTVDTSSTVYKNIEQVPPSHTISVVDGRVTLSRYCTSITGERLRLKSNHEYEEAFRAVFQSAVTARLRTHRKIGAELSGGLDSGSVASFAAKAMRKDYKILHTFSYVPLDDFKEWTSQHRRADERPFIQSTVAYVGNIKEHYLSFEGKSPLSEVNDLLEILEMPYKFFENSFWLKGIHEKAHQEGIGVLLNGARGNLSVSWGPALEYQAILMKKMKWIRLYHEIYHYSKNLGVKKSRVLSIVGKKAFPFIKQIFSSEDQAQLPLLISPELAKTTKVFDRLQEHGIDVNGNSRSDAYESRKNHFEQLMFWDKNGTKGTKLSLRYAVWERDPTNDLRVIRFCLSVPEEQYVQNGMDRALIRRSTENYLPEKVRFNQRIRGFQAAEVIHRMAPSWNALIEELQQLSIDPIVSAFLNIEAIKTAVSKIQGVPSPQYVFNPEFTLLMRSLIVYRFIKNFA